MRAHHRDAQDRPQFSDPAADPSSHARIVFQLPLVPDITLVGFNLTKQQVQAEDWWFLLAEHPTAPRFGLDLFDAGNPRTGEFGVQRKNLDWNDLTDAAGRLMLDRFLSPRSRALSITDDRSTPATFAWQTSAANVARALLQNPVRAAFDARKLIDKMA
ncbi:hypothetical protein [Derxia lacustris]|uniref:hypothetical protein n=1 Tax=Derxia lacustris TaxID=764842 RepID=UPI000A1733FF|nr:hypothetical protein [Derxia lacustris]